MTKIILFIIFFFLLVINVRSFVVVVVLQLSLNNALNVSEENRSERGVRGRKTNIKQASLNLFNKPKRAEAKRIAGWKKKIKTKMKNKKKMMIIKICFDSHRAVSQFQLGFVSFFIFSIF